MARFVSHFGITPRHCALLWYMSEDKLLDADPYVEKIHVLWTMNLLKTDDAEQVMKGRWGSDEKTIKKWVYVCLNVFSRLRIVRIIHN